MYHPNRPENPTVSFQTAPPGLDILVGWIQLYEVAVGFLDPRKPTSRKANQARLVMVWPMV